MNSVKNEDRNNKLLSIIKLKKGSTLKFQCGSDLSTYTLKEYASSELINNYINDLQIAISFSAEISILYIEEKSSKNWYVCRKACVSR